jgi:type II secretory pathway pseudopilin PulG
MNYKRITQEHSYSLMEVLITITLLGFLAAIAFPSYGIYIERARARDGEQNLLVLAASAKRFVLENQGINPTSLSQLDVDIRPSQYFDPPVMTGTGFYVDRSTGLYRLTISFTVNAPVVSCTHHGSTDGFAWCQDLPYRIVA